MLWKWFWGLVEEFFVAKVTGCGRVTIPLGVRDVSGVKVGDYVRLSLVEVLGAKKAESRHRVARR